MTDAVLFHGDCLEILPMIADGTFHLTVFSPPYDAIRDYKGYSLDMIRLGQEIYRTTVDGGVCAMVLQDGTKDFKKSLTVARTQVSWCDFAGWNLFECVIYSRFGRPGKWWNQRFRVDHEYILIFFKGERPRYFNKEHLMVDAIHAGKEWSGTQRLTSGELVPISSKQKQKKCRGTVWQYATSNTESNKIKLQHPATMPYKLAEDLILAFSQPGDDIFDPTAGSGTTGRAALNNERNATMIESAEEYCTIIQKICPEVLE